MKRTATALAGIVLALGAVFVAGSLVSAAATANPSAQANRITVRPGDTLTALALRAGVSMAELAAANNITDPNHIRVGDTLIVPSSGPSASQSSATTYRVAPGDNVSSIAHRFGTTPSALAAANHLRNANVVVIGSTLTIPATTSGGASGLPAKLLAHPERLGLRPVFERWSKHYGISPALLEGLCWMESGWQNSVVSSTGAIGIGQLMPDTVDWARQTTGLSLDPHDPDDNIRMSARFLRYLLDTTGDQATALASYYQGLRSVREGPLLPDTKNYVSVIQALAPRFA